MSLCRHDPQEEVKRNEGIAPHSALREVKCSGIELPDDAEVESRSADKALSPMRQRLLPKEVNSNEVVAPHTALREVECSGIELPDDGPVDGPSAPLGSARRSA